MSYINDIEKDKFVRSRDDVKDKSKAVLEDKTKAIGLHDFVPKGRPLAKKDVKKVIDQKKKLFREKGIIKTESIKKAGRPRRKDENTEG